MNKTVKGCLLSAILFIFIILGITFLLINRIDKSFVADKQKVDLSWEDYVKQLHYRNSILLKYDNVKNIYNQINKTENYLKQKHQPKKDLLNNEYVLNDSLRKYSNITTQINLKLNKSLSIYNDNVTEFNTKYSSFPYNYLRIKKSVELYDHFEIQYGLDNSEILKKNQKIDDWIKNGGELE
ncbi:MULTISPECIES: hypothetical protein [Chryseobacterium]|uniref:LemA protein n=1 Tax=Chryseobacterium geocarposphaerae TaxID=1416776 RepID=A0ABU1LGM9_9FLAO|nr:MULTISPECIES: hypothetical protein [Chryseobacterium]MDR6405880.1 hypothetical protein [Chryseobacterium geocarposphaerae]MDR6698956.1 hypothetical protein [Chryseobacterium ginsenosidimutans]